MSSSQQNVWDRSQHQRVYDNPHLYPADLLRRAAEVLNKTIPLTMKAKVRGAGVLLNAEGKPMAPSPERTPGYLWMITESGTLQPTTAAFCERLHAALVFSANLSWPVLRSVVNGENECNITIKPKSKTPAEKRESSAGRRKVGGNKRPHRRGPRA